MDVRPSLFSLARHVTFCPTTALVTPRVDARLSTSAGAGSTRSGEGLAWRFTRRGAWRGRGRRRGSRGSCWAARGERRRRRCGGRRRRCRPARRCPGTRSGPLTSRFSGPMSIGGSMVAPTTAPIEPSPSASALRRRDGVEDDGRHRPTVGGDGVLELRALGVGGQREHEDARVVGQRGVDERVERPHAEIGADGDGVDGQRARSGRGRRRRTPAPSTRCRRA